MHLKTLWDVGHFIQAMTYYNLPGNQACLHGATTHLNNKEQKVMSATDIGH